MEITRALIQSFPTPQQKTPLQGHGRGSLDDRLLRKESLLGSRFGDSTVFAKLTQVTNSPQGAELPDDRPSQHQRHYQGHREDDDHPLQHLQVKKTFHCSEKGGGDQWVPGMPINHGANITRASNVQPQKRKAVFIHAKNPAATGSTGTNVIVAIRRHSPGSDQRPTSDERQSALLRDKSHRPIPNPGDRATSTGKDL